MCGSNDIVKKDGLYVCQFCGTKYSVEDAKKDDDRRNGECTGHR